MLPIAYVKIGLCAGLLAFSWYLGFSFEASRFAQYKSDQIAQSQAKEKQYQEATDEIRKAKDAQIANINNQLADALISLRNRPSRTEQASNGQGCNGSALFAEDAEFLIREASRADQIRVALQSCYAQYDAIK